MDVYDEEGFISSNKPIYINGMKIAELNIPPNVPPRDSALRV
jgi:hypothetical protein